MYVAGWRYSCGGCGRQGPGSCGMPKKTKQPMLMSTTAQRCPTLIAGRHV